MNAHPCEGLLPKLRKMTYMSYQYGNHMAPPNPDIYFGGDGLVVSSEPEKESHEPPAWLVADWLIAQKRGERLSDYAMRHVAEAQNHAALGWLSKCLNQYEDM